MAAANVLLLDEPTNHLDLTTREALSMALNEFEGTVMLVSHDRALLREVCDEFWLVTEGAVKPFDGDLDDYQRWLLDQSRQSARAASGASTAAGPAANAPGGKRRGDRKAQARQQGSDPAKPLRKELQRIDEKLALLATQRSQIEANLGRGTLPATELAEEGRRLKRIAAEIESLEAQWLAISAQVDALPA